MLLLASAQITQIHDKVSAIDISTDESDESDATCPKCGFLHLADNGMWMRVMAVRIGLTCPAQTIVIKNTYGMCYCFLYLK